MGLPPPVTPSCYNNILKKLSTCSVEQATNIIKESANRFRNIIAKEEPENIEIDEKGNIIAKISVTVDGTWQKRGHSSKIGTVFMISVQTGEVLDYTVKSLVCHTYMKRQQDDKTSKDDINRWELHKPSCLINHSGSLHSMESEGAREIVLRSIEKNSQVLPVCL